ncbi:MAG: WXG100 family type VII secretion target [Candidatus Promineifilaceae bacterium]
MSNIIKMDYGMMEDMSRTFQKGVEGLQDTSQQMQSIANMLENGALVGRGGMAFTDAIRSKLCPAIGRLIEKFEELSKDVADAMGDMKEADDQTESMF